MVGCGETEDEVLAAMHALIDARVDVITIGQEFVLPGQKVDATNVTASTGAESTEGVPS
jgi:lipoate synthase